MPRNDERRTLLVDAALAVLAREGSRGLTHRAVDAEAGLPKGTCVNYLRSRDALFQAMGERIFERLTPSPAELDAKVKHAPSRGRLVTLMHELMQRAHAQPNLHVALLELRLESTRRPELARALTATLRRALALDVSFHETAALPGGRCEVVLLHLAIGGLILNTVTLPEVLEVAGDEDVVRTLVTRLVPESSS